MYAVSDQSFKFAEQLCPQKPKGERHARVDVTNLYENAVQTLLSCFQEKQLTWRYQELLGVALLSILLVNKAVPPTVTTMFLDFCVSDISQLRVLGMQGVSAIVLIAKKARCELGKVLRTGNERH